MSQSSRPLPRRAAAGLAVGALALGGALAASPPASAGDGHHGGGDRDRDRDVTITLTQGATRALYAGDNWVSGLGSAEVRRYDGRIVLSLPVSKAGYRRDGTARLGGGIGFLGDGPDLSWKGLVVDVERGVVTAVSDGSRITVLKVARRGHDRASRGGGHDRAALVLTRSGAASLNRAADGSPFKTGQTFAADSRGCR